MIKLPAFDNTPRGSMIPAWASLFVSRGESIRDAFGCDWDMRNYICQSWVHTANKVALTRSVITDTFVMAVLPENEKMPGAGVKIKYDRYGRIANVHQRVRTLAIISDVGGKPVLNEDGDEFFLAEITTGRVISRYQNCSDRMPPCLARGYSARFWMSCVINANTFALADHRLYKTPDNAESDITAKSLLTTHAITSYAEAVGYIQRATSVNPSLSECKTHRALYNINNFAVV